MKPLAKRSSIALLSSTWVLALVLGASVPMTSAYAGDSADCEDGDCATGDIPSEKPGFGFFVQDEESGSDSEGDGFDDDDSSDDAESGNEGSEGGAAADPI